MATGDPKKNRSVNSSTQSSVGEALPVLHYAEKRPAPEILATPPGDLVPYAAGKISEDLGALNRLYLAENLPVLASLSREPSIGGHIRLVYIDPPFATETVFHSRQLKPAYEDLLSGGQYVEFLRERLLFLRELLAEDGSIYVHLDGKMVFHIKLIMDEIFGAANFRNCITRKKCNPKNYTRKQYGNITDYILFYSKTANYVWNRPVEPWTEERAREYQYVDEATGRRFMKVPVHAPGIRHGETGKRWRGMLPPPGKHWQFPPSVLKEMDRRGEIYWSANGNPRRKIFLDDSAGVSVQDLWLDFKDAHNQNIQITGYPTEKNPDLLARIIEASSNPGDWVLDCFSGSGTTLAVADRLDRRWIGVDNSTEAVDTTLMRFERGLEPMGDFVSQRNEAERKEKEKTPTLFSVEEREDEPEQAALPGVESEGWFRSKRHTPIINFALFTDTSLDDSARAMLLKHQLSPQKKPHADLALKQA